MKNQKFVCRSFFIVLFVAAFAFAPATMAQRYLTERIDVKALNAEREAKSLAQFTESLAQFFNQAETLASKPSVSRADSTKAESDGQRVKGDLNAFRSNLQALITKLKAANRWNDQLDADFAQGLGDRKVKSLLARGGGARKLLEAALNDINSVGTDIDNLISGLKAKTAAHARAKSRLKCALLFVGVAAAELARMPETAKNIDAHYDKNCGPGGGAATTE